MKILETSASHWLLLLAVFLALPPTAAAQSAKKILMTSLEEYERRMEGIENYTIVQETMGFESSITFERTEVDGRTVFLPRGQESATTGGMSNFYRVYPKIAERAELAGRASVDGEECYVVVVDLSGLDLDEEMALGDQGDFVLKQGKLCVDTDDHVIRKMEMEGEITADGETRPMTAVTVLSDYREVEGMLHPFRMHITATGLAAGMSEEDAEEARKSLEEMEKNLEGLDAAERAMLEPTMGPQMQELRKMLESGQFEVTVITKEVRVNE